MTRIFIAGYQHETNTFAPSLADWAAFNRGDGFPAWRRGQAVIDVFRGVNAPTGGFIDAAAARGWTLVPSGWGGATPSSYVTADAFERIAGAIVEDLRAALAQGLDAVYLDLHGAAVAENADDSEGELLARVRAVVGEHLPVVASLDLHANVTHRMIELADALVAYRTYPHVDMAATGDRAAQLLERRLRSGAREPVVFRRLPFLIPLPAQSTWMAPADACYARLQEIDDRDASMPSFCMGFPAADFAECAPSVWAYGGQARRSVDELFEAVADPGIWRLDVLAPADAVMRAMAVAARDERPVVIADTQDNSGAGADSNTTGMLHALRAQGAGRQLPGQVVVGMLYDPAAAARAHEVGEGGHFEGAIGAAVPIWTGGPLSEPPFAGRFAVRALADGRCTLKGPMMTGMTMNFGPSACLEVDGLLVAVVSGKAQLLDREMLRMVGVAPEAMRVIVVKSSNHFRADFTPIASEVLVAKAPGPMAADPGDLPWRKLPATIRRRP
jgi:microcystin degradation protein MlrC